MPRERIPRLEMLLTVNSAEKNAANTMSLTYFAHCEFDTPHMSISTSATSLFAAFFLRGFSSLPRLNSTIFPFDVSSPRRSGYGEAFPPQEIFAIP